MLHVLLEDVVYVLTAQRAEQDPDILLHKYHVIQSSRL